MIGNHDYLVGIRPVLGHPLQAPDDAIEPLKGGERFRAGRAGVVGNLVVVHEIAVDGWGAATHLFGDEDRVQLAKQDVSRGSQSDVGASA